MVMYLLSRVLASKLFPFAYLLAIIDPIRCSTVAAYGLAKYVSLRPILI